MLIGQPGSGHASQGDARDKRHRSSGETSLIRAYPRCTQPACDTVAASPGRGEIRARRAGRRWLAGRERLHAWPNEPPAPRTHTAQECSSAAPSAARDGVTDRLLPAVPDRYRALVGLAGGTGLRWGECVGLRWDAVDLGSPHSGGSVRVERVAVEVNGNVSDKPYPKSRAGRRVVPLPPFAVELLQAHRERYGTGPANEVFTNEAGGPVRRSLFRARVWRPALARAGLLGNLVKLTPAGDPASVTTPPPEPTEARWRRADVTPDSARFATRREGVDHLDQVAGRGLRFHDLRHPYATWLVSDGVPVNDVQAVMGHEQASTTLDTYTHARRDGLSERVLRTFVAPVLRPEASNPDNRTA